MHCHTSLEFLDKFSTNNFALSYPKDNVSEPLNRGGIVALPLLRTPLAVCQKSREPRFWEVMESFVLLAYANLAASRTLSRWLLICLNFTLNSKDLVSWYKRKKWLLWTMAAAQAAENHGDEWGLTWCLYAPEVLKIPEILKYAKSLPEVLNPSFVVIAVGY